MRAADLRPVAEAIAVAHGARQTGRTSPAPHLLAGWVRRPSSRDDVPAMDAVAAAADEAGARVALSDPHAGVDAARTRYDEAMRCRRVAVLTGPMSGAVVRWRDVALLAMLASVSSKCGPPWRCCPSCGPATPRRRRRASVRA